jgi:hypothetical protein
MLTQTCGTTRGTTTQQNTYCKTDMGTSNIDVTMSTQNLANNVRNWRVRKDITDSDHRLISFILLTNNDVTVSQLRERKRFNTEWRIGIVSKLN